MKKLTVLIADDSRAFRELEGGYLSRLGFHTLFAEDGAEALRVAQQERPDLILLDIQMPVMDGVQVLSVLKQDNRTSHIPIIVVTTINEPDNVQRLLEAGALRVLSKPIRGTDLKQTIEPLLADLIKAKAEV